MSDKELDSYIFGIVDNLPFWIRKAASLKDHNLQIGLLVSSELEFKDDYSNYGYPDIEITENVN